MAHFMIGENGEAISWFHVPLNRTVTLVQWGGDAGGNKLEVAATVSPPALDINPLDTKMKAASTAFTIRGVHPQTYTHLVGYVAGSQQRVAYTGKLEVWTGGAVQNQPGYEVDLLANAARHGDAQRVHMYSKFLTGHPDSTNPLSQDTRRGHWNCGAAARAAGPKLFGGKMDTTGSPNTGRWYKSGHKGKMANLRFDPKRMAASVGKIQASLRAGNPVRLWVVVHDDFADTITAAFGHYLTLIGIKGNRFLIFDPWPFGSMLKYDGGVYTDRYIAFLGELEFDPNRPELGLRSPDDKMGNHYYVAVAGP